MELKKLKINNLDAILDLEAICFPGEGWKKEDWEDLLTDERSTYYAFMDGERLVGSTFTYNWKGEHDYVKIMNIAVHPDYRKQGLAHKLMALVHEEMHTSGLNRICAETRASNKAMQKIFDDCGYKRTSVVENGYDNPQEDEYKYVYEAGDVKA